MKRMLLLSLAGAVLGLIPPVAARAQLAVCKTDHVNVRAQATTSAEIITRLKKGDSVFILEEITLKKPKADDPANWAKITFPTNAHVWVDTQYVNQSNNTVRVKKLNVRAGPGENYSVVGSLAKDDTVAALRQKEGWTEIQAPTNAFAFVAMDLLTNAAGEPPVAAATNAPAQPAPVEAVAVTPPPVAPPVAPPVTPPVVTAAPVTAPPVLPPPVETPVVTQPVATPSVVPPPVATTEVATGKTESTSRKSSETTESSKPAAPAKSKVEKETSMAKGKPAAPAPGPKRIITREGKVHRAFDPNTPTGFVLDNIETGLRMDFLFSATPQIQLKKYLGFRVIVTGEEGVDKQWPAIPVLTVQTIELP